MDFSDMFGGRFFTAEAVEKPKLLTIKGDVTLEEMAEGGDKKWVIWFEEDERGVALNKTRGQDVVMITGSKDTTQWAGHKLVVFQGQTRFQGKIVPCVAVRKPKQQNDHNSPATSAPVDDTPLPQDEFGDEDIPF